MHDHIMCKLRGVATVWPHAELNGGHIPCKDIDCRLAVDDMEPCELEVCQVTSKELVHDFILDYCQRMRWVPGKMDDLLTWVAGSQPGAGVYIGSLNGQPVTGIGMFQHNDNYAFVGLYYCEEKHRGKGYGFKTWKVARASLNTEVNLALDAEESAVTLYEREGFKRAWDINFYDFSVSAALEAYLENVAIPEGVQVKPCKDVDFQKLKLYTEDVIGFTFDRSNILESWISLPTHTSLAAVKENGDIVGFATIRESITLDETGYRLAPLLADSSYIARVLLLQLAKKVSPKQKFRLSIPAEINPDAQKIAEEVKGRCVDINVRMYTKYELPVNREKYFGMFAGNLVG